MNHEILSRLTFPAQAAAALKIELGYISTHTQFCHTPSQKPKMCFNGILKENIPLTAGD